MIKVLGSSSKGNCYIVGTDDKLIIECGVSYALIAGALGYKFSSVSGCLITHEHMDHCREFRTIANKGIDLYASAGTLQAMGALTHHRSKVIKGGEGFVVGKFRIMPFDVRHDAVEPNGFLIYHPYYGKILFATDTYYINYVFPEVNTIMIECNYSMPLLKRSIESGLPEFVCKRIQRSHFSLERVIKYIKSLDRSKLRAIYLLHLSGGNSDAAMFKRVMEKIFSVPVIIGDE